MSAAVTTSPAVASEWALPPAGRPGVPFTRLLHAEMRKFVDTRAGRGLLIAIGAISAVVLAIIVLVTEPAELELGDLVLSTASVQVLLVPALGILAATSEWSQRTGMTTFTQEPRRGRVSLAKLLVALGFALACTVVLVLLALVATLAAVGLRDAPDAWVVDGALIGRMVLVQVLVVAQGVGFGMLFLSTPVALVTYYVLPTVFSLLTSFISWLQDAAPWIDLSLAARPLYDAAPVTGEQWAQILVTTLIWVGLPILVGHWRISRREVK